MSLRREMAATKSPGVSDWIEGSSQSSPDPLTLSSHTFPKLTTPIRARSKTPMSQRRKRSISQVIDIDSEDQNPASPSKSIIMDAPGNASPWRIKVTVEAQPRDDEDIALFNPDLELSAKKKFSSEVIKTTVPLKDADETPPSRGRRKPRRLSTAGKKRKPTPARKRTSQKADTTRNASLSEIAIGSSPTREQSPTKSSVHLQQLQDGYTNSTFVSGKRRPRRVVSQKVDTLLDASLDDVQVAGSPSLDQPPTEPSTYFLQPEEENANQPINPEDKLSQRTDASHNAPLGEIRIPNFTSQDRPHTKATPPLQQLQDENTDPNLISPKRTTDIDKGMDSDKDSLRRGQTNSSRLGAFNFATLTPLHEKHVFPAPTVESHGVQPQQNYRRAHVGIIPKGWSAPIFSPLPRRSPLATMINAADDSSLLDGDPGPQVQMPYLKEDAPTGMARVEYFERPWSARADSLPKHAEEALNGGRRQFHPDRQHHGNTNRLNASPSHQAPEAGSKAEVSGTTLNEKDALMWRNVVRRSLYPDEDEAASRAAEATREDEDDDAFGGEMTGVIGEATMMQSEEFSMVSIGSLPSARELHSSFVEKGGLVQGDAPESATKQTHNPSQQATPQRSANKRRSLLSQEVLSVQEESELAGPAYNTRSSSSKKKSMSASRAATSSKEGNTTTSQPETPVDSPEVYNMSSILQSWRRNLAPIDPSFIATGRTKNERSQDAQQARATESRGSGKQALKQQHASSELLSSPRRDSYQLSTKLPTPSSSEHSFDATGLPSAPAGDDDDDDDAASQTSLRTRLQQAAEDQLRSESNASYAAEFDTAAEEAQQAHEEEVQSPSITLAHEVLWQREREEVIRQAQAANTSRIITIDSESESEGEHSEEEAVAPAPQSDGVDIWQEEASRATDDGADDAVQDGNEHVSSRLQADPNPRPSKIARSLRNNSASETEHERKDQGSRGSAEGKQKISPLASQQAGQEERSAAIRNLFKSITGTTYSPLKAREPFKDNDMDEEDAPEPQEKTSAGIRSEAESPREEVDSPQSTSSSDSADRARQSELRSPDARDTIFDETFGFPSSPIRPAHNSTMLSDVRQLHREISYANNLPTYQEEEEEEEASQSAPVTSRKRKRDETEDENPHDLPKINEHQRAATPPSLLSRVWNSLWAPPSRPTHPLLAHLPLLPKNEPWTRTHYLVLHSLYQYLLSYQERFSHTYAFNKTLYTARWRYFEDMEFANHGVIVRMDRNLITLAAIFAELLMLKDVGEFERVQGVKIDAPRWGRADWEYTDGRVTPITEFTVVIKVFSLILGAWMREQERLGIAIEGKGCMYWRLKGEKRWSAGGTAYWRTVAGLKGFKG